MADLTTELVELLPLLRQADSCVTLRDACADCAEAVHQARLKAEELAGGAR